MIFVTVGTELPFDRLIKAVDLWAQETGRTDIFAQIGDGGWEPQYLRFNHFLDPYDFAERFRSADAVVAHAGMGTILSALQHTKPILIMPRRSSLGEQRNDHQVATARRMLRMGKVNVAFNETELRLKLHRLNELTVCNPIGPFASEDLLSAIRDFIWSDTPIDGEV